MDLSEIAQSRETCQGVFFSEYQKTLNCDYLCIVFPSLTAMIESWFALYLLVLCFVLCLFIYASRNTCDQRYVRR